MLLLFTLEEDKESYVYKVVNKKMENMFVFLNISNCGV